MSVIESKLNELNIILPDPPEPVGSYVPAILINGTIFTSGILPIMNKQLMYKGRLTDEISIEKGIEAAELATLNCIAIIKKISKNMDKIKIIKLTGYVNSSSDFYDQSKVINGASNLLFKIFGENGMHTRVSIGVSSLPMNSPVEIDMIAMLM
ncbi:MAG: RidA family protein [Candidatus Thermoplasmatota archaeon]|jgi:enamine deaminase RidA (YjgF/YER057c/UK114 family)|nr:RidA family protein [Candidatus Thermoplasmatota archaeon]